MAWGFEYDGRYCLLIGFDVVEAKVVERPWGKWEIPSASDEFKTVEKDKIEFLKRIPAKGKAEIAYVLQIAY